MFLGILGGPLYRIPQILFLRTVPLTLILMAMEFKEPHFEKRKQVLDE
jgi:hypothetical protein